MSWRSQLRAADARLLAELEVIERIGTARERKVARRALELAPRLLTGRVSRLRLPLYGRYCGPGHSGPGAPVDRVDAACRRHDRAYTFGVQPARADVARRGLSLYAVRPR